MLDGLASYCCTFVCIWQTIYLDTVTTINSTGRKSGAIHLPYIANYVYGLTVEQRPGF